MIAQRITSRILLQNGHTPLGCGGEYLRSFSRILKVKEIREGRDKRGYDFCVRCSKFVIKQKESEDALEMSPTFVFKLFLMHVTHLSIVLGGEEWTSTQDTKGSPVSPTKRHSTLSTAHWLAEAFRRRKPLARTGHSVADVKVDAGSGCGLTSGRSEWRRTMLSTLSWNEALRSAARLTSCSIAA
jgi:hypothetical protein